MHKVTDIAALEALYGTPGAAATRKVADRLTPLYRQWIMASKLCLLSTVGPNGTDGSPRGDDGPVVLELDAKTLAYPIGAATIGSIPCAILLRMGGSR